MTLATPMKMLPLVRCSDCPHGNPGEYCRLHWKQVMYSRHWRRCDVFKEEWRPDPKTPETVHADLKARGLGGYVKEVVNLDGDIAIRLVRGAPYHIKQAVGEALRG